MAASATFGSSATSWRSPMSSSIASRHGVSSMTFIQGDDDQSMPPLTADSKSNTGQQMMASNGVSPLPFYNVMYQTFPQSPSIIPPPLTPSASLGLFDLQMAGVSEIEISQLLRATSQQYQQNQALFSNPFQSSLMAIPQSGSQSVSSESTSNDNPRKTKRKVACIVCHQAKTSCNGNRPCERCVRVNKSAQCVDRPSKVKKLRQNGKRSSSSVENKAFNHPSGKESTEAAATAAAHVMAAVAAGSNSFTSGAIENLKVKPNNPNSANNFSYEESTGVDDEEDDDEDHQHTSASETENSSQDHGHDDHEEHSDEDEPKSSLSGKGITYATIEFMSKYLLRLHRRPYVRDLMMNTTQSSNPNSALYLLAHLQEIMHYKYYRKFLLYVGYSECKIDKDAIKLNRDKKVPRQRLFVHSNAFIPSVTFPSKFHFNWSRSPSASIPDSFLMSNATLIISRPDFDFQSGQCVFCQCNCKCKNVEAPLSSSPGSHSNSSGEPALTPGPLTPQTSSSSRSDEVNLPNSHPILASQASSSNVSNLNSYDLHMSVRVNAAFERLFGYSQREVKLMFVREGKRALFRLSKDESLFRMQSVDMQTAAHGQSEFRHFMVGMNKYQGEFACLLLRRIVTDDHGLFQGAVLTWIALPTYSPHVREEIKQVNDALPQKIPFPQTPWQ